MPQDQGQLTVPKNEDVLDRWNKFAELYDKCFRLWSMPAYYALLSALDVSEPSVRQCLEVACGPGHLIKPLRQELPAEAVYVATDFSGDMINKAKEASAGLSGVEVCQADAQSMPADYAARFDRVIACLGLHLVPDCDAAISELFRVCRPGGLVGAAVWGKKDRSPLFTILDQAMTACRERGEVPPDPIGASAPKMRSQFYLGEDDSTLPAKLAAAGFEDCVTFHVECPFPAGSAGGGRGFAAAWLNANPQTIAMLAKLDDAARAAVEREVAAQADAVIKRGAPIACDVLCVVARKASA